MVKFLKSFIWTYWTIKHCKLVAVFCLIDESRRERKKLPPLLFQFLSANIFDQWAFVFECKYAWADLLTKTWWKYPTSRLRKFLCKVGNCLPSWMAILRGASLFLSWCLCFGIFFAARDSCKTRNRHFVKEGIVPTCGLQESNFQDKINK